MVKPGKYHAQDTEENRQICRKYSTLYQNNRHHSPERYKPGELFCVSIVSRV
jgi:hypothetical protein